MIRRMPALACVAVAAAVASGACGSTAPTCAYTMQTPTAFAFNASGGTGTITVNTRSSCRWYAGGNAYAEDWVRVSSAVQAGNASVVFTVAPSVLLPQLPLPRSGAIDIFKEGTNERLFRVTVEQR